MHSICFSLSDPLHPVWQSLGASTCLHTTRSHSFLWLRNIPLFIGATSSLPSPLWWTLRFFLCCFLKSKCSWFTWLVVSGCAARWFQLYIYMWQYYLSLSVMHMVLDFNFSGVRCDLTLNITCSHCQVTLEVSSPVQADTDSWWHGLLGKLWPQPPVL